MFTIFLSLFAIINTCYKTYSIISFLYLQLLLNPHVALSSVTMVSASMMHLGSAMARLNVTMVQMRPTAVSIMNYQHDEHHSQRLELTI